MRHDLIDVECPDCGGTGAGLDFEQCETCGGEGTIETDIPEDYEDNYEDDECDGCDCDSCDFSGNCDRNL